MRKEYTYRNCQSLFGYAQEVHRRSGGICQLCGAGAGGNVSFDLWRQLSVEHLIGKSQGGHYEQIEKVVAKKFPALTKEEVKDLAWEIELENMVTACSFCNSMTSRDHHDVTMDEVIKAAPHSRQGVLQAVKQESKRALLSKKTNVKFKLISVRAAFKKEVLPGLRSARREASHLTRS